MIQEIYTSRIEAAITIRSPMDYRPLDRSHSTYVSVGLTLAGTWTRVHGQVLGHYELGLVLLAC